MRPLQTLLAVSLLALAGAPGQGEPLPGTSPLTEQGDLAARMVAGIDRYLMRALAASPGERRRYWNYHPEPGDKDPYRAYLRSVQPNRERLRKILGVVDKRVPFRDLEYVATTRQPALLPVPGARQTKDYTVHAVRWPVLPGLKAEGLLLEPRGKVVACVVAIPDAGQTPEVLAGLVPGHTAAGEGPPEGRGGRQDFARSLAENGCRVLVPTLIDRQDTWSGNPDLGRMTNQPHREFVYRMAYEMGRHIIGYEVQKVLAAVDWFCRAQDHPPVGLFGYGEGGLLAYYAAAVDDHPLPPLGPRIRATVVSGYFGPREGMWEEPIYRNVHGLLREFGDAELVKLAGVGQDLVVEYARGPEVEGPPAPRPGRSGAAPGRLRTPERKAVEAELERSWAFPWPGHIGLSYGAGAGREALPGNIVPFLARLHPGEKIQLKRPGPTPQDARPNVDPAARQKRQLDQLIDFTQKLLRDSGRRRQETFWSKLDTSSLEKYQASCEPLRRQLWEEVIGKLPAPTLPPNARSRQVYDEPRWKGYEVMLDLYPDVFTYGILLLPRDLKPGERRPVIVCQHGLEGRPTDVVNPRVRTKYYNSFGAQLADRGYIVYAPQNPYIGQDRFRVLQRKANPLGLSLFSFIVRQHERTLEWLATLPNVDARRIAFYGLSYGGKTAMRVPALLPGYCLSICSGDFNEWVAKNASVDFPGSYVFSGEYEMPEFNLGHTFNYAEMAALIAPRPFMVERGHDDGVGIDEMVAWEYARVRRLYSRLKVPERTEIEFFAGGHEIHGVGTFRFLHQHLGR